VIILKATLPPGTPAPTQVKLLQMARPLATIPMARSQLVRVQAMRPQTALPQVMTLPVIILKAMRLPTERALVLVSRTERAPTLVNRMAPVQAMHPPMTRRPSTASTWKATCPPSARILEPRITPLVNSST
jgi:hypothetical protein